MELADLKTNNKFKQCNQSLQKQVDTIKSHSLQYGRICVPIYIWEQTKDVVIGHCLISLAQEHPELQYTIVAIPFADWKEAQVFAVEYIIMQPELSLWDKLVLAIDCEYYWEQKSLAKGNQGTRTDLHTGAEGKLQSQEVNKIIAEKVGCSTTSVSNFKTIFFSGKEHLIEKCKNGESISSVYDQLKGKDKKTAQRSKGKQNDAPEQFEILRECNIFYECEKNIDIGQKNLRRNNGELSEDAALIEKVQKSKIPDGKIWIVFNKSTGVMDVVKKSIDSDRGIVNIKIDSFVCNLKENSNELLIFEADHINAGPNEYRRKDESEFEHKETSPALIANSTSMN